MTEYDGWEDDVNEAVTEEWVAETTPFDRVKEVLLATTSYHYARSIAEQAHVSEPSARKHLNTLAVPASQRPTTVVRERDTSDPVRPLQWAGSRSYTLS